jgi:hypothetical protein
MVPDTRLVGCDVGDGDLFPAQYLGTAGGMETDGVGHGSAF